MRPARAQFRQFAINLLSRGGVFSLQLGKVCFGLKVRLLQFQTGPDFCPEGDRSRIQLQL